MIYSGLSQVAEKIDSRQLSYRFDLEKDVSWNRISEDGIFIPEDLLQDFGVDISKVGGHIKTMFQWAYSLSIIESFITFEQTILLFITQQTPAPSISLNNLCQEENKHIEMFVRYREHLRNESPYWATHFPKYHKESNDFLIGQRDFPGTSQAIRHYLCWLTVLFIEEFSVYLYSRLQGNIQPCWLSMHKAHRNEEIQHIVTDAAYLKGLDISREEKSMVSKYFVLYLTDQFHNFTCTNSAVNMIAGFQSHHQPKLEVVEARKTKFFDIILRSPHFKQTRKFCEPLKDLRDMIDVDS